MILKRLAEGIRDQNWFVVMVEIMIVVVGIFIGLQVDDWNESRKDRVLEGRYLERIDQDLQKDIAELKRSIETAETRRARGRFLLSAAEDPGVIAEDPPYFVVSIEQAGYTLTPAISNHTFEEIKSSGRFAILRNEALRGALSTYYDQISRRLQWDYIREYNQVRYMDLSFGILDADQMILTANQGEIADITLEQALAAHTRMMAKPEFIAWLPTEIRNKIRDVRTLQRHLERAEALRTQIAADLGTTAQ